MQFTNAEVRQGMLKKIGAIGESLKESRKRITSLQAKGRALGKDIEGLNTLIAGLQKSLEEREKSVAMLQTQVQGLEAIDHVNRVNPEMAAQRLYIRIPLGRTGLRAVN